MTKEKLNVEKMIMANYRFFRLTYQFKNMRKSFHSI
jgi:hypothetical protein